MLVGNCNTCLAQVEVPVSVLAGWTFEDCGLSGDASRRLLRRLVQEKVVDKRQVAAGHDIFRELLQKYRDSPEEAMRQGQALVEKFVRGLGGVNTSGLSGASGGGSGGGAVTAIVAPEFVPRVAAFLVNQALIRSSLCVESARRVPLVRTVDQAFRDVGTWLNAIHADQALRDRLKQLSDRQALDVLRREPQPVLQLLAPRGGGSGAAGAAAAGTGTGVGGGVAAAAAASAAAIAAAAAAGTAAGQDDDNAAIAAQPPLRCVVCL